MMRKGKACSSTTAAEEASISKSSKSGATSLGSGGGLKVKKGPWSAEEDELLKTFILSQQSGKVGGWRTVPRQAGLLRCGKSCRLRWMNYLRPNLKRGVFSPDEDDLILRLHRLLGNRWALIAGRIPGRTDNEIKNYWNSHLSKNNKNFSESHNPNPNPPLLPLNLSAPSPASSTVHVQANPLHIHSNSVNTNSTSNTAIDRDHHNNHLQQSHVPYSSNSVVTETRRRHLQYNHYHPPSPNFPSSDHYLSFHHINNTVSNNYNNNTTASIELQQATWSVATSTSNNNNHHVPTPATPLPALSLETSSTMQLSVTVETDNPQLIYHHNDNCEGDPDDVDDDRGAFSSFVNSLINYDHLLSQPDDIEHDNNNVTTPEPAPQSGSLLHPSFNTMLVSSYGTAARSRGGSLYYHYDDDDDNIPSPGHFDDAEHVRSTSLTHLHCMSVSPTASNSR